MHRKLTISVDEKIYEGLHAIIGRGNISRFLEDLARPYLRQNTYTQAELEAGYRTMAADEEREKEAVEWTEAMIGDGLDQDEAR